MFTRGQKIYYIWEGKKVLGIFSHMVSDSIDKWRVWAHWSGGWSSGVRFTWMSIDRVFSDEPSIEIEDDPEYSDLFI